MANTPKITKTELVWKGKGEHVLQNPETGKWEFCGSEPLPPRPLIEVEAFGDEKGKNLLNRSIFLSE